MKPKYQYHLKTWGGFYNDEYKEIHGLQEGDFLFDTEEEREAFIEHIEGLERTLGAYTLMLSISEGYDCTTETICYRVCEWEGEEYLTKKVLGVGYGYTIARYIMGNKWYPGFNDYPLGKGFEHYRHPEFKIKSEWITGAFTNET